MSSQSYGGVGQIKFSKSVGSLELDMSKPPLQLMSLAQVAALQQKSYACYTAGAYKEALVCAEKVYDADTHRTDNLLLLGAIHFQLRNFSESIFYNQQCVRVDPTFSEAYSNLGNALKELGDLTGAIQFYMKAIKLKPRFPDAYNNLASAYMLTGQTQQAMDTYNMALTLHPDMVDAHTNLGNLHKASGDLEKAKQCYLEAIKIKPEFPIAWNNLAGVFKEEGQPNTAVAYYKEAIRLCPEFADAHSNLGNALKETNLLQDAIASYQTAIKLRPDFAIAHGNLGSCYYDLGDFASAIKSFNYAIQLEPNFADAYNNLGNALKEVSRLDEAINAYRSALHLKPDHPHAYNNLGNAMIEKGYIKEAIHCYVTAIRLMPKFSAAHCNLGSVFKEQGKMDQSIAHYLEAIKIDPAFADAFSNLGNAYKETGHLDDAMVCYNKALALEPNYAEAYSNLAATNKDCGKIVEAILLYKKAMEIKPDFGDVIANLFHAMTVVCDWTKREEDFAGLYSLLTEQLAKKGCVPSVQPWHAAAYPLSLSELLQISKRYAARVKMNVALSDASFKFRPKNRNARLKVGYVSSNFGNHPMSQLIQSMFSQHNSARFEVFCYTLSASDGSLSRLKMERDAEHVVDISGLHACEAAELIHNDGIHVLVNLNGYTKGAKNEIFALRPAPIQVALLGHLGSMGADYIDYIVADNIVIPPELTDFYSEKMMYLPHCFAPADHKNSAAHLLDGGDHVTGISAMPNSAPTRAHYGISEDKFVFCNFGQLFKIDPLIFDVWMNLLKRVKNSVLWLLRFPAAGEVNILREARKRGVRESQIVFSDVAPREEHIRRGVLADLFLDTTASNAHTTACDILWSGTPLVTMKGEKMTSRVAASLLRSVGLEEDLVVKSYAEYEELCVSLAEDSDRLFQLRTTLEARRNSCALFDSQRWVRNWETALQMAWRRQESRLPPDHLQVEDKEPVFRDADGSIFDNNNDTNDVTQVEDTEEDLHDIHDASTTSVSNANSRGSSSNYRYN